MRSDTSAVRRQLLQGTALGLAALATGCAHIGSTAKARVVVVGGGWGGLGAVRALAEGGKVHVTLVEPNERFMSCPLSAHFIAGLQPETDFQRSYAGIDRLDNVRRVSERVLSLDRAKSEVVTATQRIGYDFLVLSPGIEYMDVIWELERLLGREVDFVPIRFIPDYAREALMGDAEFVYDESASPSRETAAATRA